MRQFLGTLLCLQLILVPRLLRSPTLPASHQEEYRGSFFDLTVGAMLKRLGVTVSPLDKVTAFPDPALGAGSLIKIERVPTLQLVDGNTVTSVQSWQPTVQGLLTELQVELGDKDTVTPALDQSVANGAKITITRVAEVQVTKTESIAYTTKKVQSADLEQGQTQTTTKGVNGTKVTTYTVRRVNGQEVSRTVTDVKITLAPVTEVVTVGTGLKLAKSGPYQDIINAAAKKYGINGTALRCLMMHESGGTANTGYPDGAYKGLFQYGDGFWASASAAAGYAGASIYDAEAQIFSTARALTHGQAGRWPPWSACANQ